MIAVGTSGQSENGAPGIHIPIGGAKTGEGRHNVHAVVIRRLLGKVFRVRRVHDQAQLVPEPLDQRTAHKD